MNFILDYVNENEYRKLERALKKYNMLAFKKLNFEYYPALRSGKFLGKLISQNKKAGTETYELRLPSDHMFAQVHGECNLIYTVYKKEETIMLSELTPKDILLEGHQKELTTYKGVMVSKSHKDLDMFKINLLNSMNKNGFLKPEWILSILTVAFIIISTILLTKLIIK